MVVENMKGVKKRKKPQDEAPPVYPLSPALHDKCPSALSVFSGRSPYTVVDLRISACRLPISLRQTQLSPATCGS